MFYQNLLPLLAQGLRQQFDHVDTAVLTTGTADGNGDVVPVIAGKGWQLLP